jgi:hypothetical protein
MVYLGGPRGRRSTRSRGIYLHDPPPGYHPPRPRMPLQARRRQEREDRVLLRVVTVTLILLVTAAVAIFAVFIATHL